VDTEHHSYSGRDYATIDEANKQHFYRTDAFGRLQQVCEVTGSGNDSSCGLGLSGNGYTTVYAYDAQNNLLRVDQKGSAPADSTQWRSRQFTYDRLGRLLTAANPESGTIFYAYDANGNLLQKTGPAANQAGTATQTTSFCYDGMNRITGKAYSAQTCQNGYLPQGLAAVSYVYDIGANAAKGHLTSWTDQAGSANYSYDVAGHISSEQRTLNGVPNPITKTAGYTYNPDDSLATLTYPSGAVVTYAPDSAGRFLSAVDVGHNTSYVTAAVYSAGGSIATFVSGSSSTFAGLPMLLSIMIGSNSVAEPQAAWGLFLPIAPIARGICWI